MLKGLLMVLVALVAAGGLAACGPGGPTLVVDSTGDGPDAVLDGTCATSSGAVSPRT